MDNTKRDEIFLILQEECAEVTQAISKVLRFGIDSKHPVTGVSNRDHLTEEVGDLVGMLYLLVDQFEILDDVKVEKAADAKIEKLKKWSNIFK